jgi:hypothetical protein
LPVALEALEDVSLPRDMLDAALKALFGTRKLALDGGAIQFVVLPDRFRSALFWLFHLTVNAKG